MTETKSKKVKISKILVKRLPKGQRAHTRRVKQEARKTGTVIN